MARSRTITADFFTADAIARLSPLARLLYIGACCEADRYGYLDWRPTVLKRRYLPDDACDAYAVATELIHAGFVYIGDEDEPARIVLDLGVR
jgi:hypothetical protein